MISTRAAILRTRRDLILGIILKLGLGVALAGCLTMGAGPARLGVLFGIGFVWLALNFTSARGLRVAAMSPSLIAAGRYDEAEEQIDRAIRSFSLFRAAKLQPLHYLALLRHAQRRWSDSAQLCRALLGQRLGVAQGVSRGANLILAHALLELGELQGAHEAIERLHHDDLNLVERLNLLLVQLDYSSRVGAWDWMTMGLSEKIRLAELMPTEAAARSQAFLALAALQMGQSDLSRWLASRAALLMDEAKLIGDRPSLAILWPKAAAP